MSTKIVIDNVSGSLAIDGIVGSAPVPSEAGATLISNSSNQWVSQAVPTSWRNRLINGDMSVSQRNGDAFVSPTSSGAYTVDRWRASNDINLISYSTYFDGSGDYLSTGANANLAFGTGDFTVETWVYFQSLAPAVSPFFQNQANPLTGATSDKWFFGYTGNTLRLGRHSTGNFVGGSWTPVTGVWYHCAVTRQSGTVRIFLDGTLLATDSSTFSGVSFGQNGICLGAISTPYYLNGFLSNSRIVVGTALYTSSFTPSTVPLTDVSNTRLLACASSTNRDSSSNNLTVTANGNAAVNSSHPFGNIWSTYFGGSGGYLRASANQAFDFGAGDFTIEAWINIYSNSSPQSVSGLRHASLFSNVLSTGIEVLILGSSTTTGTGLHIGSNAGGAGYSAVVSNFTISQNAWNHIAIVRSSGIVRFFLNGVKQGADQTFANTFPTGGDAYIGGWNVTGYERYFMGDISNFRIVKGTALYTSNFTPNNTTPLTAVSGTSLLTCASNRHRDLSSNNFTITPVGGVSVGGVGTLYPKNNLTATVGRETGYSAYFDGSGDCAFVGGNAALYLSGDFTVECWVNLQSLNNGVVMQYGGVANLAYISWYLGVGTLGDAYFGFRTSNSGVAMTVLSTSQGAITTNTWKHLAATRSGNSYKLFLDGVLVSSLTTSNTPYDAGTGRGISIGGQPTNTWGSSTIDAPLAGYVSNLRIIKGTALYTANFTPSATPLVPVTSTSLLTCASSTFADKSSNNFAVTAVGNAAVSPINPFTQAGFGRSLRWAVSTPGTPPFSTSQALIQQRVEGSNIYDFSWGTAGARAATLSFWVNSPVAGTYCAAIRNPSLDRSYVAEYTVSAANTWERKTVNIPGPTSGFWPTDNSEGLRVSFDMGSGTNYNTTAGAWQVGNFTRTSGALSFSAQALVASNLTNNFYVVGVQLELGSVATPYEILPYGKQLESCQRYFARMGSLSGNNVGFGAGCSYQGGANTGKAFVYLKYPQQMRAAPTVSQSGTAAFNTTIRTLSDFAGGPYYGTDSMSITLNTAINTQTVGQGVVWTGNSSTAYVDLDAEL